MEASYTVRLSSSHAQTNDHSVWTWALPCHHRVKEADFCVLSMFMPECDLDNGYDPGVLTVNGVGYQLPPTVRANERDLAVWIEGSVLGLSCKYNTSANVFAFRGPGLVVQPNACLGITATLILPDPDAEGNIPWTDAQESPDLGRILSVVIRGSWGKRSIESFWEGGRTTASDVMCEIHRDAGYDEGILWVNPLAKETSQRLYGPETSALSCLSVTMTDTEGRRLSAKRDFVLTLRVRYRFF